MTPEEYQAAGLYDPSSGNAEQRLELLDWTAEQGFSLEQMVGANAIGQLLSLTSLTTLRRGEFLNQTELAQYIGVSLDAVEEVRLAAALPPRSPEEAWCTREEAQLLKTVTDGSSLLGREAILRLLRVIGWSASRVAEAMWAENNSKIVRMVAEGATELEIAKANVEAIETARSPAQLFVGLLPIHLELAARRMRSGRNNMDQETVDACVGFVDLVGSTTLSRELSAKQLAAMVDRFEEVCHRIATNVGGRLVKFIGDEVMFVTNNANAACEIALQLIEEFAGDQQIKPRGGVAFGTLLDRAGDYYGPTVSLAARLAELAIPNEVLASAELSDRLSATGPSSEPAGSRMLRGFSAPVPVRSVTRRTSASD